MGEFRSWRSYSEFSRATRREQRYVRSPQVEEFLNTVLAKSKGRETPISKGSILWRAQLGCAFEPLRQDGEYIDDMPAPFPPDRMKPLRAEAPEGRANPKGIPYLYLSTKRDTALSEVRPWLGSLISVAQFKAIRDLTVLNCSVEESSHIVYFNEPSAEHRDKAVWSDIDRAFSEPVTLSDRTADYVPTQILAELFKANGFDGVAYRSALDEGVNIVLFDIDDAEMINC